MTFSTLASPGVSLQGGGGSGGGTASLPISGNGATITTSTPLIDGTQTWNNAAVTFTGAKINVTDTASAAASLLMDLQVGTASQFSVSKTGALQLKSGGSLQTYLQGRAGGAFTVYSSGGVGMLDVQNAGTCIRNVGAYSFGFGNDASAGGDTFFTRRAAANFRLGAADAAAPVAQTLSVQSVVTGTSNTAGANLTITGSQSTGSGAGGSIIFQTAAANSGGGATIQNTLANAMVIDSVKTVRLGTGYTVATLPAAGTAGRRTYVTDATLPTFLGTLTGGGAVVCPVFDNGTAWVSA